MDLLRSFAFVHSAKEIRCAKSSQSEEDTHGKRRFAGKLNASK
jgi:hypothetical protein